MSDMITVWEKCEHGRLEPHGVGWHWAGHEHTVGCKPPVSEAKNGYHWSDGCPGGRKIVMRLIGEQKAGRVWVEVSDE